MSLLAAVDLNGLLQFIFTLFILCGFLLYLVKNTTPNYFLADESDNDWSSSNSSTTSSATISNRKSVTFMTENMGCGGAGVEGLVDEGCVVCRKLTNKKCARCKMVKYCSEICQKSHWNSGHKAKCKDLVLFSKSLQSGINVSGGSCNGTRQAKMILYPYDEFVDFFNWNKPGFPPCGLINCGNSCFANVVLQCLAYTKPLVAFLLEKGHRRECRRNDWCFLCEFQTLVERACLSSKPFSPINILSRLPNMGGNLGYGKQEDAHEFMRFAIDKMQSVCLDIFGGEKVLHPSSQETTLIQHIFGGHLQSQVICTKCENVSNQFEKMMDLTVEIHGDAASLEECLDQFTAKERLHGDNMYKCDGCNDYVMAWKRLSVRCAPNILTIAFKRFQSGRFGKLNKRVTFPETLDLNPYMSEEGDDTNIYKLYAVIVHLDMLNASFFGHYICYIKDFQGKWYGIDDCKVIGVDLDEVLSQGAYMLLYSRICARSSSLYPVEDFKKIEQEKSTVEMEAIVLPSSMPPDSGDYIENSYKTFNNSNNVLLLPSKEVSELKDISEVEDLMDIEEGSRPTNQPLNNILDSLIVVNSNDDHDIVNHGSSSNLSSVIEYGDQARLGFDTENHCLATDVVVPVPVSVSCAEEEIKKKKTSSSGGPQRVSRAKEEVKTTSSSSWGGPQRVVDVPVAAGGTSRGGGGRGRGVRSIARPKPFFKPGFLDKVYETRR